MVVAQPILVIGATGQLARALARQGAIEGHPIICRGRPHADITDKEALARLFAELSPAAVVNAAAYTAVDDAQRNEATAYAVNAHGPGHLAELCRNNQIALVHVSTDYVFDGASRTPYREDDPIAPLGIYGASKAAGEAAIRETHPQHLILRTSWLYDSQGKSFLTAMLRQGAQRDEMSVVDDQRGAPTWAGDLAAAIAAMLQRVLQDDNGDLWGTYHVTNGGETTWHGFAAEILRLTGQRTPQLKPIGTSEFPTLATRPPYSVLDNSKAISAFGIEMPAWQDSLSRCMAQRET